MKIYSLYKLIIILFVFVINGNISFCQNSELYWVQFKDKVGTKYKISAPLQFLSQRALDRRNKNNCLVTEQDFPVNKNYLDSLENIGITIVNTSRWFNAATISFSNDSLFEVIKSKPFVNKIERTRDRIGFKSAKADLKLSLSMKSNVADSQYYKYGYLQISLDNGTFLHKKGFKGKGVQIAVIDAGFRDVDTYVTLEKLRSEDRILGTKDFVYPQQDIFSTHYHGAAVLSMMAGDSPGIFSGTAPEASYWLLRSEDASTEYPVEEDNWIAAAEFADSAGVDIINTSLGYTEFDNPIYNHTYSELDGKTTRIAIAAKIAASKGIIVVVSAGNDGASSWHYISTPADAEDILTIGAVNANRSRASFSSFGPSADNRVKPDVCSMGDNTYAEVNANEISEISGTSCSAPITSGLISCLLQAFPDLKSKEIINAVIASSNQSMNPDSALGYGIPDFLKAFLILYEEKKSETKIVDLYPNPCTDRFTLFNVSSLTQPFYVECFDLQGNKVFSTYMYDRFFTISLNHLKFAGGMYLVKVSQGNNIQVIHMLALPEK